MRNSRKRQTEVRHCSPPRNEEGRGARCGGTDAFWDYSAAVAYALHWAARSGKRAEAGKAYRVRGPSNERKMPNNAANGRGSGREASGGRVRENLAENLACILGARFKPGQAGPGLKRKKGVGEAPELWWGVCRVHQRFSTSPRPQEQAG